MPKKLTIKTRVNEHGHLPMSRREEIATYLTLFAGGDVQITIEKPKRSVSQNAFYHGFVIRPIRERILELGLTPVSHDALHAYFRDKYLDPTVEVVFGEEKILPPSTTKLNTTDFYWYVEAVRTDELVLELGVQFPEMEEHYSFDELPY